jgi:hypothetical protein
VVPPTPKLQCECHIDHKENPDNELAAFLFK